MHRLRAFLVIVSLTIAVWFFTMMSDIHTYPTQVRLQMVGYDTARYALMSADSVLNITIESNGFSAARRALLLKQRTLRVDVSSLMPDTSVHATSVQAAVSVADSLESLMHQLRLPGVQRVRSAKDSLRLSLKERCSRRYLVSISPATFSFEDQYGLCGQPTVEPQEVVLYGSAESLEKINEVRVMPTAVANIHQTGSYKLDLEAVWASYPDVHPSVRQVKVTVPVERYVEKSVTVPLKFVCSDTSLHVRLYPERVEVEMWVTSKDYARLSEDMVSAEVRYDISNKNEGGLPVVVTAFPAFGRVKRVIPDNIQYVVIK